MLRRGLSSLLWLSVALAVPGVAQVEYGLPVRLELALDDLRERDPGLADVVERALVEDAEHARRVLAQHAKYQEELERAARHDARRYALLKEQERHETDVRLVLGEHETAVRGSEAWEAGRRALREVLDGWFDVRHELRALDVAKQREEIARQEAQLEAARLDPAALRDEWRKRLVAGQHPDPRSPSVQDVAPELVRLVSRSDVVLGELLAQLAETDPQAFVFRLRRLTEQDPALLERARRDREAGERPAEKSLREALAAAITFVAPLLGPRGLVVPAASEAHFDALLDDLARAQIAVTQLHVEDARQRVQQFEQTLAYRQANRALLIDLQAARMLGEGDRFEW